MRGGFASSAAHSLVGVGVILSDKTPMIQGSGWE